MINRRGPIGLEEEMAEVGGGVQDLDGEGVVVQPIVAEQGRDQGPYGMLLRTMAMDYLSVLACGYRSKILTFQM